jgi:hypothetical protein
MKTYVRKLVTNYAELTKELYMICYMMTRVLPYLSYKYSYENKGGIRTEKPDRFHITAHK